MILGPGRQGLENEVDFWIVEAAPGQRDGLGLHLLVEYQLCLDFSAGLEEGIS